VKAADKGKTCKAIEVLRGPAVRYRMAQWRGREETPGEKLKGERRDPNPHSPTRYRINGRGVENAGVQSALIARRDSDGTCAMCKVGESSSGVLDHLLW